MPTTSTVPPAPVTDPDPAPGMSPYYDRHAEYEQAVAEQLALRAAR